MSDGKDNIDQISANNDSQEEINLAEESSVESSKATLGFLDKILEIVTGISRDDRIKFRKLKDINKRLKNLQNINFIIIKTMLFCLHWDSIFMTCIE
jgi:hypothetical protein